MSFIILIIGTSTITLSRILFGKWFNHLAIYAFVWMVMLYLYELKLVFFYELTTYTWLVILSAFLAFTLGSLTIFAARGNIDVDKRNAIDFKRLFFDDGKKLKYVILGLAIVGILSALQHWSVLLNKYGTIPNVILNAYSIYKERASGELTGVIPYIWLVIYPSIFLAGIYTAYKGKISIITLLPFIALILKESANLSRAGILFGFSEFTASFFLFRHLLKGHKQQSGRKKVQMTFGIITVIIIMIFGAVFVKTVRQVTDTFKGTSSSLTQLKGGVLISPSIYFYGSSQVAVLNQFLEKDVERKPFGNSTFYIAYNFLAKFGLTEEPLVIERGYYTPTWSNTATYLREIYSDFGYLGIFIVPYLLGIASSFFWIRFYQSGKLLHLVVLTHLYIVIIMSFFVYQVRSPKWTIGGFILLLLITIIEKMNTRKSFN